MHHQASLQTLGFTSLLSGEKSRKGRLVRAGGFPSKPIPEPNGGGGGSVAVSIPSSPALRPHGVVTVAILAARASLYGPAWSCEPSPGPLERVWGRPGRMPALGCSPVVTRLDTRASFQAARRGWLAPAGVGTPMSWVESARGWRLE